MAAPLVIGITGGSGSGKTYFLKELVSKLPSDKICILSFDNYYKPRSLQPKDELGIENFDTPQSLDSSKFITDLKNLMDGNDLTIKEYTFNNPNVIPKIIEIKCAPVIIIEGIFVLYFREIFDLLNLKIYVEASNEIMLTRRIQRDAVERGYDLEDVKYRFANHVMPAYEQYIAPKKNSSDLIIPNESGFDKALEVVVAYISSQLKGKTKSS